MRLLILIRGLPGSGKSYLADALLGIFSESGYNVIIRSTDYFWLRDDKYDFQQQYLDLAHKWNQSEVAECMFLNREVIIVDNTNTTYEEMAPYLELAARFGYNIKVCEPETPWAKDWRECAKHCSHNVPDEVMEKMAKRWQSFTVNTIKVKVEDEQAPVDS